jgi:RNA polymerase sigma-70 factor, ECF subfamily
VVVGRSSEHEQFLRATLRHSDLLHALARRLAPNPADVADIVQETSLRAYAAWPRRRPDDTGAWMATICLNVGRDMLRRHSRYRGAIEEGPVPDLASPADTAQLALDRISANRVQAALLGLPEAQRIAITLMDICGFSAKQVAAITNAPRGTVLARVHRGRKLLALRLLDTEDLITAREVRDEPQT